MDWEHCLSGNPHGAQDQRSGVKNFLGSDRAEKRIGVGNRNRRISQPTMNKGFALKNQCEPFQSQIHHSNE